MMRSWKIASLVAALASLGIAGCASETEVPAEETKAASEETKTAEAALEAEVDEESTDEDLSTASTEVLMSVEEETDEAALAQFGPMRPPLCRFPSRRVRLPSGGYICRIPGGPATRPFCPPRWSLTPFGGGWMCRMQGFPPHRPLSAPDAVEGTAGEAMVTPIAAEAEETCAAEDTASDALMSVDEEVGEAADAQIIGGPQTQYKPPVCRHPYRRVRVGHGYLCFGPGPFAPLPQCVGIGWRRIKVGHGYLCVRTTPPLGGTPGGSP